MDKKIIGKMGLKGVPGFTYADPNEMASLVETKLPQKTRSSEETNERRVGTLLRLFINSARAGADGRAIILLTEGESFFMKNNRHLPIKPHPDTEDRHGGRTARHLMANQPG
jgi:hypothetical protein